jgi:folate-dependent phosphoribosylglycinamide formyltransferase PurN
MIRALYTPRDIPMNVVVFTSGSGTNAIKLLEHQAQLEKNEGSPYRVTALVTDNREDRNDAWKIADKFRLEPPIYSDFKEFLRSSSKDLGATDQHELYFKELLETLLILKHKVDYIALAGYERIISESFLGAFADRIVNVHPGDLSIRNKEGKAVYAGKHAVMDAILAGDKELRSSTHLVVREVDQGSALLISEPVTVKLPDGITLESLRLKENARLAKKIADEHQDGLKRIGDWHILPLTIELIARGAFGRNENGMICLNSQPIPNGFPVASLFRT